MAFGKWMDSEALCGSVRTEIEHTDGIVDICMRKYPQPIVILHLQKAVTYLCCKIFPKSFQILSKFCPNSFKNLSRIFPKERKKKEFTNLCNRKFSFFFWIFRLFFFTTLSEMTLSLRLNYWIVACSQERGILMKKRARLCASQVSLFKRFLSCFFKYRLLRG